jgi:hypothetical protein
MDDFSSDWRGRIYHIANYGIPGASALSHPQPGSATTSRNKQNRAF